MRSLLFLVALARTAAADDGYCDFVAGAAAATSDIQLAPQVFADVGYIEQSVATVNPDSGSSGRFIVGVRWSLSNALSGVATRDRASADCTRHKALELVRGETNARALEARAKVLDAALAEADKVLAEATADLDARRTTAQEATATRLRVEELRGLAVETHRQLSLYPAPGGELGGALAAYQRADAEVEHQEGKLRFLGAFDVNVRVGIDEFFTGTQSGSPYFAVLEVGVNLGALFVGGNNDRAAKGRKQLTASGHDPLAVDATVERLNAVAAAETKRAEETAALQADLQKQLDALARVGGEDSKRYRITVWFELVKAKADHAYFAAHVDAIGRVVNN